MEATRGDDRAHGLQTAKTGAYDGGVSVGRQSRNYVELRCSVELLQPASGCRSLAKQVCHCYPLIDQEVVNGTDASRTRVIYTGRKFDSTSTYPL